MSELVNEEELSGGNSGPVTRVGATVRRTAGPWTPTVQRLLTTLRAAWVHEVPEPLGLDEQGREVLSYLPGEVALHPPPDWLWSASILAEAGALLRRVHDASVPVAHAAGPWQLPSHEPVEVVCHNDVAPYNLVFVDGRVTGLIDFDTSSPGPRIWDLAYLAYRLVPYAEDSGRGAPSAEVRPQRLSALIRAYDGDFDPSEVLLTAAVRLEELAEFSDQRALERKRPDLAEHAAMYRRDAARLLRSVR